MNNDSTWWSNRAPGLGTFREEAWDDLMTEPNSAWFFYPDQTSRPARPITAPVASCASSSAIGCGA